MQALQSQQGGAGPRGFGYIKGLRWGVSILPSGNVLAPYMSYSLNSLKRDYIRDYIGDYYRAY